MEYTCEVKLDFADQVKFFAIKTINNSQNCEQNELEEFFDVNKLVFNDAQDFEGEALQLYTDLLIQKLPESRLNNKQVTLGSDMGNRSNFEVFIAKRLSHNEELYLFSSKDETSYNTKIGIIHQIMKKAKDSFDMGHQKLFDGDENMEIAESPSCSSPNRRRLKIRSSVKEISLVDLNQNFLNELLHSSFKWSLILTNNWFLLSDRSMILSTPVCQRRYNSVTKFLSWTKYQRVYFKRVTNSATCLSWNSKSKFLWNFDICFSLPVSRIVQF